MGEITPISHSNGDSQGLTPIHPRIHCAATPDTPEDGYSETDMILVKNFLNTLAEVAIAAATRKRRERTE